MSRLRMSARRSRRPSACSPTSRAPCPPARSPRRRRCVRRSPSVSDAPTRLRPSSRRSATLARSPSCRSATRLSLQSRWVAWGRAIGLIANNTMHMAGALTSNASLKGARFLELCNNFGIPVLSLIDTPGFMVGPAAEQGGLVRHASRLLLAGAALQVPLIAVILRRGYGLGAQAMAGGSLHEPLLTLAWPGAHLGPMGLEGAVRLALRKELGAIEQEG